VLSADYFSVPEEEIKGIESVLTMVAGKVVHGTGEFTGLAPPSLPVVPEWSPVKAYGGYHQPRPEVTGSVSAQACARASWLHRLLHHLGSRNQRRGEGRLWGLGCECFAF